VLVAGPVLRAAYSTQKARFGEMRANRGSVPGTVLKHPFHDLQFLTTAASWPQLPEGGAPEVAFAGRSNAGKSSAINALAQRTRLAYVSRTPGRTQHINFFRAPSGVLLADLPGYGYAAVPAKVRRHWEAFIARYLSDRAALLGLVLVMDARHPFTTLDRQLLHWFLPGGRPVRILLTKADKLSPSEQRATLQDSGRVIAQDFRTGWIEVQLFSALKRIGLAEVEAALGGWLAPAQVGDAEKERPRHQGE
jgi:GTP-binding protein